MESDQSLASTAAESTTWSTEAGEPNGSQDTEHDAGNQIRVIAVLGALVIICDQIGFPGSLHQTLAANWEGVSASVATVAAIVVVATRGNRLAAVVMVGATLIGLTAKQVGLSNHGVWIFMICAGAALVVARSSLVRRTSEQTATALRSVVVWVTALAYSAAAFSKLNSDFLDPAVSCATVFVRHWTDAVGVDPSSVQGGALGSTVVWGTALTELAIAVLLWIRRTRLHAAALGVVFHFLVSTDNARHFFDFSVLVMFGLTVAAGAPMLLAVWRMIDSRAGRTLTGLVAFGAGWLWSSFAATELSFVAFLDSYMIGPEYTWRIWWWWLIAIPWVLAVVIVAIRLIRRGELAPPMTGGRAAVLSATLTVLVAAGPYVGYRNAVAFTMYSNLVSDQGTTNHLILPAVLTIGVPDGEVVVSVSDSQEFIGVLSRPTPVPEVVYRLKASGDQFVEYRYGGEVYSGPAADSPLLDGWARRPLTDLRRFRPSVRHTGNECSFQ